MKRNPLRFHFLHDDFALFTRGCNPLAAFRRVFSADAVTDSNGNDPHGLRRIELFDGGDAFKVTCGTMDTTSPSFPQAAFTVMQVMGNSFVGNVGDSQLVMHAATALVGGRAVLFAGPSGSGKTSLALAISEHEGFVGDECAYVNTSSGSVEHESFPFQLKACNARMLHRYDPNFGLKVHDRSAGDAFYMPLDMLENHPRGSFPISAVVFPSRIHDGGSCRIGKADPAKLPSMILGSLIGPSRPSTSLVSFLSMCETRGVHFYEAIYSDAFGAAEMFYTFLGDKE